MVKRFNRTDVISFFVLKAMYFYAIAFGMVVFTVTIGDNKPHVQHSFRMKFLSIGFRISSLILYVTYLPAEINRIMQLTTHRADSLFVCIFQFISITTFTVFLIICHIVHFKRLVRLINRAINVIVQIINLRQNHKVFTADFYIIVLLRAALNLHVSAVNVPQLYNAVQHERYMFSMQLISEIYLWIGTIMVLDGSYVCYVAIADMYKNISDFMIELEKRFEKACLQTLSRSSRRRFIRTLSEELEECALVYSEIHNIISDFQELFQFIILFTFYLDFVSIIILLYKIIWVYLMNGQILTYLLINSGIRATEIVVLLLVSDRMLQKSRIPELLNWDTMCSDDDKRWNRAVDIFLNGLKFQNLKLEVFGLFQMNNKFSLRFLSVIGAYLTVLVQFTLLGYFRE